MIELHRDDSLVTLSLPFAISHDQQRTANPMLDASLVLGRAETKLFQADGKAFYDPHISRNVCRCHEVPGGLLVEALSPKPIAVQRRAEAASATSTIQQLPQGSKIELMPGDKLYLMSSMTSGESKWGFTVRLSNPAAADEDPNLHVPLALPRDNTRATASQGSPSATPGDPAGPYGGQLELQKETPPSAKRLRRSLSEEIQQQVCSKGIQDSLGGDSPPKPSPKKAVSAVADAAPRHAQGDRDLMFSGAVVVMHRQNHVAALRRRLEALGAKVMRSDEVQEGKGSLGWDAVTHVVSSSCEEARGLPGLLVGGGCWALPRAYFETCLRERRILREEDFAFAVGKGSQGKAGSVTEQRSWEQEERWIPAGAPVAQPAAANASGSKVDSVSVARFHCADQEAEPQRGASALPLKTTVNTATGPALAAPAPDAALRPGIDIWGLPYDQKAAEAALKALRENYAPMNRQGSGLSAAHQNESLQRGGGGADDTRSGSSSGMEEDVEEGMVENEDSAGRRDNAAADGAAESGLKGEPLCLHPACGYTRRAYGGCCIIKELQEAAALYRERTDVFRRNAIATLIRKVEEAEHSLEEPSDIDLLLQKEGKQGKQQGAQKSREKLREILATGRLKRNEMRRADPRRATEQLFCEVWGVGDAVARRWYNDGCRSLEDVRGRSDLNERQRAGLKYFEDMKHRIPRAEVESALDTVRSALRQVLPEDLKGSPEVTAQPMGSYRRGRPSCGDVDVLVFVPSGAMSTHDVIASVLHRLQSLGFVTEDIRLPALMSDSSDRYQAIPFSVFFSPARRQPIHCMLGRPGGDADLRRTLPLIRCHWGLRQDGGGIADQAPDRPSSWMGFCRVPGGEGYARRIDLKIYDGGHRAFAINYFTGSGKFNRALRHWANTACSAQANAAAPGANAFKLTDTALLPCLRDSKTNSRDMQVFSSPIRCASEPEIFGILGLDYVPPHMRIMD